MSTKEKVRIGRPVIGGGICKGFHVSFCSPFSLPLGGCPSSFAVCHPDLPY